MSNAIFSETSLESQDSPQDSQTPRAQAKRIRLTKEYIDRACFDGSFPKAKDIRWDTELKRFGLRVYPSGQKAFVISYRINGRKRLMMIGQYGVKTLDQARKDARIKLVMAEGGRDPLSDRQDEFRATTVAALSSEYMERYAKKFKKSWREDQRLIDRYLGPEWGTRKAPEITRKDVSALHRKVGQASIYEANRTKALISKMWECAREWGIVDENSANPARGIQSFPEVERKRYVNESELPRLAASIDQEPNVYVRAILWLYLLTGLRRNELLKARWDDVIQHDSENWSLLISETKSGEPQVQPLSPQAREKLEAIPKIEGNPYIFVGHRKGTHLTAVQKNWEVVRMRAGLPGLRVHDLRHTAASWIVQSGKSLYVVKQTLGHADQSTSQRYAHLEQAQVRDALDGYGLRVERVILEKKKREEQESAS